MLGPRLVAPAVALVLLGAGCATGPQRLYAWDGYDERLYEHYKHPQDREAWVAGLKEIILAADQVGGKVPPGVQAEYGYALFEEGDRDGAVTYFEKERQLWPESNVFMEKMIPLARRLPVPAQPTTGAASSVERQTP